MAASGVSRRGRKEGAIFRLGEGQKNLRNENGVVGSEARDTNARARPHARGTSKPAHLGHAAPQSHPPCTQTQCAHTPRVCKHAQDPAHAHPPALPCESMRKKVFLRPGRVLGNGCRQIRTVGQTHQRQSLRGLAELSRRMGSHVALAGRARARVKPACRSRLKEQSPGF